MAKTGYEDIAPYYSQVERYVGVSGNRDGLPQLPDGEYQPPMEFTRGEKLFRSAVEAKMGRRVIIGRADVTEIGQGGIE